jgi:hypothetical protein
LSNIRIGAAVVDPQFHYSAVADGMRVLGVYAKRSVEVGNRRTGIFLVRLREAARIERF